MCECTCMSRDSCKAYDACAPVCLQLHKHDALGEWRQGLQLMHAETHAVAAMLLLRILVCAGASTSEWLYMYCRPGCRNRLRHLLVQAAQRCRRAHAAGTQPGFHRAGHAIHTILSCAGTRAAAWPGCTCCRRSRTLWRSRRRWRRRCSAPARRWAATWRPCSESALGTCRTVCLSPHEAP